MSDNLILLKTIQFATNKHRKQKRKSGDHDPYIIHPITVATYISEIGRYNDIKTLQAAILHDTIEDTETNPSEISELFGEDVLKIVLEVTDDKNLSKQKRKRLQVKNVSKKSYDAKIIKLADKLHNTKDLSECPPDFWNIERIQGYFVWTKKILNEIRGTNIYLEKQLDEVLNGSFIYKNNEYQCIPPDYDLDQFLEIYYKNIDNY